MSRALKHRCSWRALGIFGFAWFILLGARPSPTWAAQPAKGGKVDSSDLIHFTIRVSSATDPFDVSNQMDKAPPQPYKARRGELLRITLTGKPKEGHYTYPLTKKTATQPFLAKLTYPNSPGLLPLWPVLETEPHLG